LPPDDDDLQQRNFQQPRPAPEAAGGGAGAAAAAAAALAALASGAVLRAQELLALADQAGTVNLDFDSTAIMSLSYNIRTGAMAVTFTDGSVYPYPPVTMVNFLRFINAPSLGSFFNKYVRGQWG
jgi:KTSC domain